MRNVKDIHPIKIRNKANKAVKVIIGWLLSFIIIVPLYIIIVNSLKTSGEASSMNLSLPEVFKWENYQIAFVKGKILTTFFNSLIISSLTILISTIISAMASFIISRNKTKLNKFLYDYIFIGLIAPINYIATIKMLQIFKMMSTYQGIILLYCALAIPFTVFLLCGFISNIPRELDEAAIIDGCNINTLFFNVIFPLLKPVTVTAAILNFLGAWNDFQTPLYILNKSDMWVMVLSVYNFYGGMRSKDWNLISAVIIMTIIPIFVVYILGQKYIVAGMTSGSVKG